MDSGQELYRRAKQIIPGGTQLLSKRPELFAPEVWPPYYSSAKGINVWDLDGKKYIDFSLMGIGANILGYADEDVDKAVINAILHGSMCTLNCREDVVLAEKLLELNPWAGGVRYTRTAGEALAVAVRIARAHTKRDKVAISGYHGWSDWYLACNLENKNNLNDLLLPGLEPLGVPKALKGTTIPFEYDKAEQLAAILEDNEVGTIVIEPIRHNYPKTDFLKRVRELATKHNAILISDEVTVGWRKNVGGMHELLGFKPDMAVFGKAMSNGFPMATIVGKSEIMDACHSSFISSTYWTEKIGPTAAIATIEKLEDKHVPKHLIRIGKQIGDCWYKFAQEHHLGITIMDEFEPMIAFDFNYGSKNQVLSTAFTTLMLERRYLSSKKGCYVSFSHQTEDVEKYAEAVDEVFAILVKAIEENKVEKLLKGPIVHDGFRRLVN